MLRKPVIILAVAAMAVWPAAGVQARGGGGHGGFHGGGWGGGYGGPYWGGYGPYPVYGYPGYYDDPGSYGAPAYAATRPYPASCHLKKLWTIRHHKRVSHWVRICHR